MSNATFPPGLSSAAAWYTAVVCPFLSVMPAGLASATRQASLLQAASVGGCLSWGQVDKGQHRGDTMTPAYRSRLDNGCKTVSLPSAEALVAPAPLCIFQARLLSAGQSIPGTNAAALPSFRLPAFTPKARRHAPHGGAGNRRQRRLHSPQGPCKPALFAPRARLQRQPGFDWFRSWK